jgi:hypothetical protein
LQRTKLRTQAFPISPFMATAIYRNETQINQMGVCGNDNLSTFSEFYPKRCVFLFYFKFARISEGENIMDLNFHNVL